MNQEAANSPRPSIMDDWSIEATLPKTGEVEALAKLVAPGTEVYLSTLPHVSLDQQIETARIVKANGFEPVLHVAARYFATRTELVGYLARAVREAGSQRMLVIGGDADRPKGEFTSAYSLMKSGLLADYGINSICIAGYPDGHPKISAEELDRALDEKLKLAADTGTEVRVVTQFSFHAKSIFDWLSNFQERWPETHVKIGLAGPTNFRTLIKFALRCGVSAPKGDLGQKLSMASNLLKTVSPAQIIGQLDAACLKKGPKSPISTHMFSFGGLERTARWVTQECAGEILELQKISSIAKPGQPGGLRLNSML